MPRHRNRAKTKKRRKQGLRPVCTALAVCLVWTVPGLARHNRVTVTTYGDAARATARAAVTETFFDGLGRQTMPVARGAGGSGSVRTILDDDGTIRQCTMYYTSGLPVQLFGTERVSDRARIGVIAHAEYASERNF